VQDGNNDICGVRLAQNAGQHIAVLVGLSQPRGSWCVVIDADLQDPPQTIPSLLAAAARTTTSCSPDDAEITRPLGGCLRVGFIV
jgi:glycosyltransferase involved in cell wall biosynthesis